MSDEKVPHQPFPQDEEGAAQPATASYTMVEPRFREVYFQFYKETYKPTVLDRKTKEFVAIAASLAFKCQGCIEGHLKKAIQAGATPEEISETLSIAAAINAAAIIDLTDVAAANLNINNFPSDGPRFRG